MRQRPNAGLRVEDARSERRRSRKHALRFRDEVLPFALVDRRRARIAVEALVGGADQVQLVPRQNEERPRVAAGLDVDARARRAGKRRDDQMAALRAADQAAPPDLTEHLVHPRPGRVHDDGCARRTLARRSRACHSQPVTAPRSLAIRVTRA